jgi:tetratricopeptide (TPR) repeat protein
MIDSAPTEVEGYRGRIEAELLLGVFSDAVRDYARLTALVLPVHPDAANTIYAGYADRLAVSPDDIPALTGSSFAYWWFFAYPQAITQLNHLLELRPGDLYGNLFRGSCSMLQGINPDRATADFERAIALAPDSPHVRYVVADGYLYGRSDYQRAFTEASRALQWGLDTPRVQAILAGSLLVFGDLPAAASHTLRHIELVTTQYVAASPLPAGTSLVLPLVAYRTASIPVPAVAGEQLWILTSSHDFSDTIMVLLAPDGTPVVSSDDYRRYYAAFQWTAEETGTYTLLATSFEGVSTGGLLVTRK